MANLTQVTKKMSVSFVHCYRENHVNVNSSYRYPTNPLRHRHCTPRWTTSRAFAHVESIDVTLARIKAISHSYVAMIIRHSLPRLFRSAAVNRRVRCDVVADKGSLVLLGKMKFAMRMSCTCSTYVRLHYVLLRMRKRGYVRQQRRSEKDIHYVLYATGETLRIVYRTEPVRSTYHYTTVLYIPVPVSLARVQFCS